MDDIEASVLSIFEAVVGAAPTRGLATTPDDVERWDSLIHVQLVFALEQDLGVRFPEEVLVTRSDVGALVDQVRRAREVG